MGRDRSARGSARSNRARATSSGPTPASACGPGRSCVVRAGTSFTSPEAAARNLEAEVGSAGFDEVRTRAESAWEDALGRVRVRGGSSDERQVFYTSLYHALLQPRLFSDADGAYPRFGGGGALERAVGFDYYDDFSLWDTFRAQHPLLVLLQPERVPHFVRSLLAKADAGRLPAELPRLEQLHERDDRRPRRVRHRRRVGEGRARLRRRGGAAAPS